MINNSKIDFGTFEEKLFVKKSLVYQVWDIIYKDIIGI